MRERWDLASWSWHCLPICVGQRLHGYGQEAVMCRLLDPSPRTQLAHAQYAITPAPGTARRKTPRLVTAARNEITSAGSGGRGIRSVALRLLLMSASIGLTLWTLDRFGCHGRHWGPSDPFGLVPLKSHDPSRLRADCARGPP